MVGQRVETLGHAQDPSYNPEWEIYPDSEHEWYTYNNAIYGDTVDQNSYDPSGNPLKLTIPGFTFAQTDPANGIKIDETTAEGDRKILFQYDRRNDLGYTLQIEIQQWDSELKKPAKTYEFYDSQT